MKLYTSKVVAKWIGVTERRVRMLRDRGVITERMPGLYELQPTVTSYIAYLNNSGANTDLNEERAKLTRAKRETADLELSVMRGELMKTDDIERGLKNMLLNFRSRVLSLPAKLSPVIANMSGGQDEIFDYLESELKATLEELSDYQKILKTMDNDEETEEEKLQTDG